MDIPNQIIALRRQVEALNRATVVFNVEPKNPNPETIWVDTNAQTTKYWDGSNWITTSAGGLTDWNTSVVFTATDYNTIAWTSWVVSIGTRDSVTDYATNSGTFDMTTTTYFYWQEDAPTAIQTSTDASAVVVAGGIVIAIGRPNPDTANNASLKVFGWPSVDQIIADEIVANSITSNMIQANAVTASKISVTSLSAINADMGTITAGNITLNTSGYIRGGQTAYDTGTGFFLGYSGAAYKFSIGNGSTQKLLWDGTSLTITGSLSATTGAIGGFDIGADYIRDAANSMGLASTVTGGDDVRFWAGAAFASRSTAPFRVTEAGAMVASSATITGALTTSSGSSISTTYLSGVVAQANLNVANSGWTQTSAFSVTNATKVSWGSGTFTASNGASYSISAGDTGTMAAKTYIYLDTGTSTTAYQVTTTASTSVGAGKVLIAVAQNGTWEATFQVLGTGGGGQNIDAASIVAASITANEIALLGITSAVLAAGAVTTAKIAALAVTSSELAAGSVIAGKIAALTIVAADIAAATITGAKIAAGTITATNITAGTITATEIAAATITGAKIAATTITASNIAASTITANEIAASTITAGKMNVSQLSAIAADLWAITAGTIVLPSGGYMRSGQTAYDSGTGFYIGNDSGTPKFSVGNSAGNKLTWNGTTLTITGTLTATAGAIGGFDIGTDYIRDAANSMGLASTVSGSDDVRFWAGAAFASRATAPFRVTEAGAIVASSATITGAITTSSGSSISTTYLSGTVAQSNLGVADRGWSQTSVFSVTDADTIAWASGTFTSADGTAYSISSGNTGNMAAKTYIYLDTGVSTTAYQTTTTASTAVGVGKVMVAIAQNATTEATYEVLSGQGWQNIDAANIVTGSITANEIAASTITAGKLSISTLSAITADMGTITAWTVTLNTSGYVRGGQTAYNTGTGFFLGYDSSAYKLSLGDASSAFLTWNGSTLTVSGLIASRGGELFTATQAAPGACTTATGAAGVLTGTYLYKITYVTQVSNAAGVPVDEGETELGTTSASVAPSSQKVSLTAIPTWPTWRVINRKIYRTKAGGSTYFYVATLSDNTTTTYTDNTADASLTIDATNRENTTASYVVKDSVKVIRLMATSVGVGTEALYSQDSGFANVAVGYQTLRTNTKGYSNVAIGYQTLYTGDTGGSNDLSYHIGIGYQALYNTTNSTSNIGIGQYAGKYITSGNANIAIGNGAMWKVAAAAGTGNSNIAVGTNSGAAITSGANNICVGDYAGQYITTGTDNIIIAKNTDSALDTEQNIILIGNTGASPASNEIRIGNSSNTKATFFGISGATSSAGIAVLINASGVLGTTTSSQFYKERIEDMAGLSEKIYALRPVKFHYKKEALQWEADIEQYGLIAEEVEKTFPELVARDIKGNVHSVRYHFLIPLMLNEIQRLRERVDAFD
jgi:hypothetical protein